MRASNQHRPYQGYPYVNPPVNDAPSIPAATASKWTTLPRKQLYQGYPYASPPVNDVPSIDAATASRWINLPRRQVEAPVHRAEPEVYVDMPDRGYSGRRPLPEKSDHEPDPQPVVYIDMPEASGSHVSTERTETSTDEEFLSVREKRKSTDDPVVYIDLPETNGSDVSRITPSEDPEEPDYVQETIFYNPFENRRIEMHKEESESDDESSVSSHSTRRPYPNVRPLPPIRPSHLDLYGAGSSGASSSSPATGSPSVPQLMSKETMLYGAQNDGAFPASPIPVSQFPEPPPAYAEIDLVSSPVVDQEPIVEQPRRVEEPPRTQVILPGAGEHPITPLGLPNPDRKYLNCHHCGMRVHTLVVTESGTFTHIIALSFFCTGMFPCIALAYCTDWFKIKNHYCPSCNKVIGYVVPFGYRKIIYVK